MGSCYSDDYRAKDHIHTDITTCNIEDLQQNYRLERSVIDYWGEDGVVELGLLDPNPRP